MFHYVVEILIIMCLLYYYFTRTFNFWKDQNVKGPRPLPFFGNFKDVAFRRKNMGQLYREVYKQYPNEKIVGIYRMTSPTLLIRDLDIVKQVLVKDFESCPDRGTYFSKEKLGDNLFHSDNYTSKILRNHFTSLFTTSKCKSRFHLLLDKGDRFTNYIEDTIAKYPEQDIYRLIQKYTVGTTMNFMFDLDFDTFDDSNKLFDEIDEDLIKTSYGNEMDMLFSGILTKFNLSLFSDKVVKFCREVVRAGVSNKSVAKTEFSVMDVMIKLQQEGWIYNSKLADLDKNNNLEITENVLAGQVFIFYTAGYGNNTLLLTYTMYYLAKYPEVQEKLIEEIDRTLEKYDGQLTFESLQEMKYLFMVFDETLRLHPLTNSLSRCVGQDLKIDGTDLTIEKGTMLVVSAYAIQHDAKYYPEPEKFHPERFEQGNIRDKHSCAYLSFGVGPRSCIGIRIAKLQYGVCVAKLLSKFRVQTSPNTVKSITNYDPYRFLLTPKERIYLNLVPRELIS